MKNFSIRFLNGIENHNLTEEEIEKENIEYCGGTHGEALEYFFDYHCKNENAIPFEVEDCYCGKTGLVRNFYIKKVTDKTYFDPDDYLILGSSCIKRFTEDIKEDYFIDDRSESELTIYHSSQQSKEKIIIELDSDSDDSSFEEEIESESEDSLFDKEE